MRVTPISYTYFLLTQLFSRLGGPSWCLLDGAVACLSRGW